MSVAEAKRRLIWHGVLLVLLGLLTGVAIPLLENPRMGVSAHLAGVQNGILLGLLGLVWLDVKLSERLAAAAFWMLLFSLYALWIGNLLGAVFGTSGSTPLAGAGHAGAPWQETTVTGLLVSGSLAIVVAVALVLYGLRRSER